MTVPLLQQKVITAVLYLRVSTADQQRNGFSVPEQRRACQEKAEALARRVSSEECSPYKLQICEFVDAASGDVLERPELERVREFVRTSRPDFFVCLDPDRFSRQAVHAIMVANEIEATGTRLEFVQHDYQSTAEGKLFFTMRVAFSQYEKAKILERTARGKRGKMRAGGIPHAVQIYGYHQITRGERQARIQTEGNDPDPLVPDAAESRWVRQMFNWVVEEHLGSQAIAERLNQMGVPTKRQGRGGVWHRGVVAAMLRNPTYAGELRLNRFDFTGLGTQRQLPPDRRTQPLTGKLKPSTEWITIAVPPIVARDRFDQAQAVLANLKRRSSTRAHPGRRGHVLSGLLTCGRCGAPMHYVWNNKIESYLVRCANRYPEVRGLRVPPLRCEHPHRKANPIEDQAWTKVHEWLTDPQILVKDLELRHEAGSVDEDTARDEQMRSIRRQLEKTRTEQMSTLRLAASVDPEVLAEVLASQKREMEAIRQQLARLEEQGRRVQVRDGQKVRLLYTVGELQAEVSGYLHDAISEQRQYVLRLLLDHVLVRSDGSLDFVPAL